MKLIFHFFENAGVRIDFFIQVCQHPTILAFSDGMNFQTNQDEWDCCCKRYEEERIDLECQQAHDPRLCHADRVYDEDRHEFNWLSLRFQTDVGFAHADHVNVFA